MHGTSQPANTSLASVYIKYQHKTTKQVVYRRQFSILWPQWWVGRCTPSGGYQVSGKARIWKWWNTSRGCVPPDQASWLYLGLGVWEEGVVEQMTDRNTAHIVHLLIVVYLPHYSVANALEWLCTTRWTALSSPAPQSFASEEKLARAWEQSSAHLYMFYWKGCLNSVVCRMR